jgi:hypothetical protein
VATGPCWVLRREYKVVVRDLRRPLPAARSVAGARWGLLAPPDSGAIQGINPSLALAQLERRWAEGQECFGCWLDGALVHYWWESTRPAHLPYLGRTFRPAEGDVCVVEAFTAPAARARGITSAAAVLALHRSRERGLTRSIGFIASWNAPSLRIGQSTTGRTVEGTVGYVRIGPWRRYFTAGGVRFGSDGAVELALGTEPAAIQPGTP